MAVTTEQKNIMDKLVSPTVAMSHEARQPSVKTRPPFKTLFLIALLVCSMLIIFLPALRGQYSRILDISRTYLMRLGWAAPLIFTAAAATLVAVGVPRLLLCLIGGMVFGFWQGLLWAQLGSLLGAYATFLFVRWSGREFILRTWPRLARYPEFFARHGIVSVLLIRQLPVAGFFINLLLGLTFLSHFDFLLGSCAGFLPGSVFAALAGSGAAVITAGQSTLYTFLTLAVASALWILTSHLVIPFLKNKNTVDACALLAEKNN